jgi:thiol-disulfide isomerase/thioredoxin
MIAWPLELIARTSLLSAAFAGDPAPAVAAIPAKPTFTENVAPIVFKNCTSCHRPGEGTPFTLMNYADVKKRADLIRTVVDDKYMPPWPPASGWGHFQDERRLSADELATLDRWVEQGAVEGPADKLPPLPKFNSGGWMLGTPDMVVTLPESFHVPADGPDIYRMFVLPLNLPEDRWVTAVEIRPTARRVVHHALYFLDDTGGSRKLDAADPGPGFSRMSFPRTGSLGGWAVGATPRKLPMDLAYPLPKGSDLVVQIHFHPSGKAEDERTSLGLYFAKERPKKRLMGVQAPIAFGLGTELRTRGIKPGDRDFTIRGEWKAPFDIDVVSIGGHALYLCKTMKAVAVLPDGREEKLFAIDDWDFNWQGRYNYEQPVRLPKGTVVKSTIVYDNSSDNPRNPSNPPVHVRWGEGSTDEMGSIGLAFVAVNEADAALYRGAMFAGGDQVGRLGGARGSGGAMAQMLDPDGPALPRLFTVRDANKDGKLTGDEIPERMRPMLGAFDTNGDGGLSLEEIKSGLRAVMPRTGRDKAQPEPEAEPEAPAPAPEAAPSPTPTPTPATADETTDIEGRPVAPFTPAAGVKANVLVFASQDCPIANYYAPELERLAHDYAGKPVKFHLIEVDPEATRESAKAHAVEYKIDLPVVLDPKHVLAHRAGAKVSPEAAVVTADGKVVYCGRIDDRFAKLGRQRPEPTKRDLRAALDAVLDGRAPEQARVEAIGCPIVD